MSYLLALDQGTTFSRAIVFDSSGRIVQTSQKKFTQLYPQAGWVEHEPNEIWRDCWSRALERARDWEKA